MSNPNIKGCAAATLSLLSTNQTRNHQDPLSRPQQLPSPGFPPLLGHHEQGPPWTSPLGFISPGTLAPLLPSPICTHSPPITPPPSPCTILLESEGERSFGPLPTIEQGPLPRAPLPLHATFLEPPPSSASNHALLPVQDS